MNESPKQKKFIRNYYKKRIFVFLMQLLIMITFISAWEILAQKGIINSFIYSSPSKIINTLKLLINTHHLWLHIGTTLLEILVAFFLGTFLALSISIIFYLLPITFKILDPFLTVLNSLPKVALGPIIIIIAGANIKSIIVMALLVNLIVNIMTIYTSFTSIDEVKIKLFKTFKANKLQILRYLVIPNAYPFMIASLKLNISLTLIGVITGEFLVSQKGIGYLIIYGTQVFNLNLVMAGIVILLIVSLILYKLITVLEKKLLK